MPPEAHVGAISAHGATGVTIQRNTVGLRRSEANSGNPLYGDKAPLQDILIEGNYLNGGTSCLWLTTDFVGP